MVSRGGDAVPNQSVSPERPHANLDIHGMVYKNLFHFLHL